MDGTRYCRRAVIVSDSRLSAETLRMCVETCFDEVEVHVGAAPPNVLDDRNEATFFVSSAEPSKMLALLQETGAIDLSSVVVLLRVGQPVESLEGFAAEIGAAVPETANDSTILKVALAINSEVCILPRDFARKSFRPAATTPEAVLPERVLTPQELRVFDLISYAHNNKLIAEKLGIADSTVRVHVRSIIKKLRVRNRTEVALEALRVRKLQSN